MARGTLHQGGRRSGWPPERSGHTNPSWFESDDFTLAILWILVLVGLLLVTAVVLSTLFGWDLRLASTAEASQQTVLVSDVNETGTPSPGAFPAVSPPPVPDSTTIAGRPVIDVSASTGATLGKVLESSIHSNILNRDLPFRVYLPPGYDQGNIRYPVLYLLHGNGEAVYTEWTDNVRIAITADALIAAGKIQPMIIMMADAEHSYYMNGYGTGERWEDYFVHEVIPFTDAYFRTIADKTHRAIGGLSMGGTGALTIAFTYPELFAAVGAHSPSLHWTSENGMDYFGPNDYFALYNPLEIAKSAPGLNTLQIWVDFGAEDPWLAAGKVLDPTLTSRVIPHQWHIFDGDHGTIYWMDHSPEYLEYYSESLAPPVTVPLATTAH